MRKWCDEGTAHEGGRKADTLRRHAGFGPVTSTAKFSYDTSGGVVTATFSSASIAGAQRGLES